MARIEDPVEATARIEAALYASGRPMRIEEIIRASGTESRSRTHELLEAVIKKTKSAFAAIEIAKLPDGSYVFQLKPEHSSKVKKYASRPMITGAALKTLSYIAIEQPISSNVLVEARGTGVYMHLKELRQLDFVEHQSLGRRRIYSTTEKFHKYFGIGGDTDELKQHLFSKVKRGRAGPRAQAAAQGT